MVLLGTSPISWKYKKQPTTSKSSAEAECRGLSQATAEVTWLFHLLSELGVLHLQPITLHCHNQYAIRIVKKSFLNRLKLSSLIVILFERRSLKVLQLAYILTSLQLVDILIKILP